MNRRYVRDVEKFLADYFDEQLDIRRELDLILKKKEYLEVVEANQQMLEENLSDFSDDLLDEG